jgi:hypothetical protein
MWQGVLAVPEHKQGFSTIDSHHKREFPTIESQLAEPKVELADDSFCHLGKNLKQRLKGLVLGGSLSFPNKKLARNYRVILTLTSGSLKSKNLP